MMSLVQGPFHGRQSAGQLGRHIGLYDRKGGGKDPAGPIVQDDQHGRFVRRHRLRFNR
jgi:hypothetical protein